MNLIQFAIEFVIFILSIASIIVVYNYIMEWKDRTKQSEEKIKKLEEKINQLEKKNDSS